MGSVVLVAAAGILSAGTAGCSRGRKGTPKSRGSGEVARDTSEASRVGASAESRGDEGRRVQEGRRGTTPSEVARKEQASRTARGRWECRASGWCRFVPPPVRGALLGVWAAGPDDVVAVGESGVALHYDGRVWKKMDTGTTRDLRDVWGLGARDVYAVGKGGTILHYDGRSWTGMPSGTEASLAGVWGSGPRDVFVVGTYYTDEEVPILLHFDGRAWRAMRNPPALAECCSMSDVWGSSGTNVYAVGQGPILLHYDGSRWSTILAEVGEGDEGYRLTAVSGSGPGFAVAVGERGVIQVFRGRWRELPKTQRPTSVYLWGVWAASPRLVYVVGSEGTIVSYDGRAWKRLDSGTDEGLNAVFGLSPGNVFVVGDHGTILHYRGRPRSVRRAGRGKRDARSR